MTMTAADPEVNSVCRRRCAAAAAMCRVSLSLLLLAVFAVLLGARGCGRASKRYGTRGGDEVLSYELAYSSIAIAREHYYYYYTLLLLKYYFISVIIPTPTTTTHEKNTCV